MMIMKSYIDQPIWTDFFGYHIRTRSSREDHDSMIQLQPGHGGGFPNPQDYFVQDVDWRVCIYLLSQTADHLESIPIFKQLPSEL
jgi:hypothetical protein